MSINIKTVDGKSVNPARDLLNAYPQVVKLLAQRFESDAWPELSEVCDREGVSWDDLCDAVEAYSKFLASPIENPASTMEELMQATGWSGVRPAARIAVAAMVGAIVTGQLHHAIRETTPLGTAPQTMEQAMEEVQALILRRARWRPLKKLRERIRTLIRRFVGRLRRLLPV